MIETCVSACFNTSLSDANSISFMQIWRMSDLIYRPEDEVLAELEKFKSHVVACASKTEK